MVSFVLLLLTMVVVREDYPANMSINLAQTFLSTCWMHVLVIKTSIKSKRIK